MSEYGRSRKKKRSRKRKPWRLPVCIAFAVLIGAAFLWYADRSGLLPERPVQTAVETGSDSAGGEDEAVYSGNADESRPLTDGNSKETDHGANGIEEASSEETEAETTEPETRYAFDAPDTLPLRNADPDVITLAFAGDILFDENYAVMASLLQRCGGEPDIWKAFDAAMMEVMRGADLFMLNNEFPYSTRGTPLEKKQFTFRARPKYASLLKDMGVDIVGLANNHVNDHGQQAMLDTFDTLEGIGMPYVGAGHDLNEASKIRYYTNGETKIGIVCATQIERMGNPDTVGATDSTPGVFRCMNPERLIAKIGEAKENCDCVIVFVHWGTENAVQTDDWQNKQAVQFAEAGADLIIGAHPHVLEKIESVRGVPVVYSLGNYWFNSKTLDTGIVQVRLDAHTGEYLGMRFVPALQSGCRTTMCQGAEKQRILDELESLSKGTAIDEDGNISFG